MGKKQFYTLLGSLWCMTSFLTDNIFSGILAVSLGVLNFYMAIIKE